MQAMSVRKGDRSRIDLNPVRVGDRAMLTAVDENPEAMPRDDLERLIYETRNEPPWRRSADLDCDYYDGNQLRADTLGEMEDRGIPPLIINLTQPIVNAVLGMEAKTRTDWEITGDDKQSEIVARMLDEKFREAERETSTDRAISEAYAGQIKAGLGWVEVGREQDPFRYPYRVNFVHRREIWWDWRSVDDWARARYLVRRRWYDQDVLEAMLPHHKDLIRHSINGWVGFANPALLNTDNIELARSYEEQRASGLDTYEWLDTMRRRAQVFEVWYRKWVRGHVLRLGNNKVIEVDRKNKRHLEVIASGALTPIPAVFPKVRVSMWLGPHRISDIASPLPHRHFPYVPFWGFREDLTGAPYGVIRSLRSPQDEVNARRSKLLSLLTGRRIIMDDDALNRTYNTPDDVADEVGRSDAMVILNSKRVNPNGFKVETNADLAAGQMKTLDDSKQEMHQVSGVFPPTIGDPQAGGMSGVAIDSLVDQSATTLAEINDNHRYARRMVGEQLLALVRQDLSHEHTATVGKGRHAKVFTFNRTYFDEEAGCDCIENSVADASVRVTLSDVPSSQTYRQAQFARISELAKGLPPDVQRFVIDFVIEASDVQGKDKIVERLRKALGLSDPSAEEGEEDPAANEAVQQLMAEHQQVVQELMAKLQPALEEVARLKQEAANNSAQLALDAERERNRSAEARMSAEQQKASDARAHELALEKLDLEHEKLAADTAGAAADRDFQREQQATQAAQSAAQPKDDGGEVDAKLTAALDDVRDMVKALADEIAGVEKAVAEVRKDEGKAPPEPVKAEDIAAALTKALGPILERREEKPEPTPPQPIVVVVPGESEAGDKQITIQTDASGAPTGATVRRVKKGKSTGEPTADR